MVLNMLFLRFDKFALQPILTSGESNYAELLMPVVGAVRKRAVPISFWGHVEPGAPRIASIGATAPQVCARSSTRHVSYGSVGDAGTQRHKEKGRRDKRAATRRV